MHLARDRLHPKLSHARGVSTLMHPGEAGRLPEVRPSASVAVKGSGS